MEGMETAVYHGVEDNEEWWEAEVGINEKEVEKEEIKGWQKKK